MTTRMLRSIALRLLGLAVGLAASALVMLATGNDVVGFIEAIGAGFGANLDSTLRWFAPLLLAGVAGVIAFRDGAFNLGLDGQIYLGAAASSVVALGIGRELHPVVGIALCIAAAIVAGAAVAGVCALLRLLFGTPEVITTLVMNPLCAIVVTLLVTGPLAPRGDAGNTESSEVIPEQLWLPSLAPHSLATVAVALALAVVAIVAVYYRFTVWGLESRLFGAAPSFSFYAGVPNVRVFLRAMLVSGGIAGLVGATEVLGVQHRLAKGFNPGLGFDGIAVALVGGLSVVALVGVAFLFALLRQAGEVSQITLGIPSELVDVMIALIILTTSAHVVIRWSGRRRIGRHPRPPALSPPTPLQTETEEAVAP
ncbi:ABC transporter permease [Agromyces sp. NPDC058126]|uniref:ABC transporter permease n=1 Tax=Agromyces sp. NPDC058126 TaxID=3346350 RepID=UPI0036DE7ED6